MHYDKNMSHEERVRIEIYEAKQKSIKWDEFFFHATIFLAMIPMISVACMYSSIDRVSKFGASLYLSVYAYQFLFSLVLGIIHLFHLMTRLREDNAEGAMYSAMSLFFLIFFIFITKFFLWVN